MRGCAFLLPGGVAVSSGCGGTTLRGVNWRGEGDDSLDSRRAIDAVRLIIWATWCARRTLYLSWRMLVSRELLVSSRICVMLSLAYCASSWQVGVFCTDCCAAGI